MAIEKVGYGRPVVPVDEKANAKNKKSEKASENDRVELSEEAKMLFAAEKAKKLGEIRAKVLNGFYDAPEVTEKVVEGLIRELRTPQA